MKNIVITGIGRSGTGYLAKLLNSFENTVVLSEPPILYIPSEPHRIKELFQYYRNRILNGEKISHASAPNGEIFEDTRVQKHTGPAKMTYKSKDFVLAIKNPIPFLNRLPIFLREWKNARYVACIRNPIDNIASMRNFNGGAIPIEPINNWYYKETDRWNELEEIKGLKDISERSARAWKWHTDTILQHRDKVVIARYKDNVENPWKTINAVFEGIDKGKQVDEIKHGKARKRYRNLLTDKDYEMIEKYCKKNAEKLDIWND